MSGLRTLFASLAFGTGIVVADFLRPDGWAAVATGAAGTLCLLIAAVSHRRNPDPDSGVLLPAVSRPGAALVCAGLAACGFSSLGLRSAALESALVPGYAGRSVEVTGLLVNDPRPYEYSSRFYLAVRNVEGRPVREKLAVTAYGRLPKMALGDTIQMRAKVKRLDKGDTFDVSLARRSVVAKASVQAAEIRLVDRSQNRALLAANHFRSRIASAAEAGAGRRSGGLVLGLVMGDQRKIPQAVIDDFRAAGLSHLTAVSGQNVAMVMAPLVLIMGACRFGRRSQAAAGLATLALFALVTRWEPSVLRAVLMASAALSAWLFGRRSDAFHLLCLVFFALLAIDPLLLWTIGFQLSFAATAGILLIGPALSRSLSRPFAREERTDEEEAEPPRIVGRVAQVAAIGISAQVAVLPFIAFHFGRLSLVALPANLLALPLVAPVTILGLCAGVVGVVSVQAAAPLMSLAGFFASALQGVARLFGGSLYAQASVAGWSSLRVTAAFLALAAAALWLGGRARAARWPAVGCALMVVTSGFLPFAGATPPSGMRLHFFDVGQGDAALVQGPSGERIVLDGGPDRDFLSNRLKGMGFSRLDLVVASHGHTDHVEGLKQVFERFEVREALDPGIPTPVMNEMNTAQKKGRRPFRAVADDEAMRVGDLTIQFLGPAVAEKEEVVQEQTDGHPNSEGSALNDASVVARISFGGQCALFPGDLEEEGQEALLQAHPHEIDCTILKAPHHGSGRLLPEFVEAVDPEWVTVSAGRGNDYGHPAPKALSIFKRAGARVARTDRMGDIVLNVDRAGTVTLGK